MRTHVIACAVLRRELERMADENVAFTFLPQGLHLDPSKLRRPIQEAIDSLSGQRLDRIVLGYGLCSNGVAGVRAGEHPLVVPRSHDCLGLLWGDPREFEDDRARKPGTYYLSRGWLECGAAPLDKLNAYSTVMSVEDAESGLREEFRNYTRLVWIDTGEDPEGAFRDAASASAAFLGLRFEAVRSKREFLRRLVWEPPGEHCVEIAPWHALDAGAFF